MSDWMDCPLPKMIVSFAGGDILTGLDIFADEIKMSDKQKNQIEELRREYREKHHQLSVNLQTKVDEMRYRLRKDALTNSDLDLLMANVDEHTNILNEMEKIWMNTVFEAFRLLQPSQVETVKNLVDERMRVFGGTRIIGLI